MSRTDLRAKINAWADKDKAVNSPIEDLSWVEDVDARIEEFNADHGVDVRILSEKYDFSIDDVMVIIESGQEL